MQPDQPGSGSARPTIKALSEEFDRSLIRMKPGGKRPATPYISHGLVTKRLNEVCPGWQSRVVEMHTYMDPAGHMQCAGVTLELTIPGVGSRQEFGTSANRNGFGADAKNAMSDALKRCAMRFGVAIDLWESADEDDEDAAPVAPQERRPAPRPAPARQDAPRALRAAEPAPEVIEAVTTALDANSERETPEGALRWLATAPNRTEQHEAHRRCRAFAEQGILSKADVASAFNEAADRLRAATA